MRFVSSRPNGDLPHELLDLRRLALRFVSRIRVAAVNALLAESCAAPNEIVDGALHLLYAIREIGHRYRGICHGGKLRRS